MSQITGQSIPVAIYHETTAGSDPATPAGQVVYATNVGLAKSQNLIDDPTIISGRGVAAPALGNSTYSGPISHVIAPENVCTWLKHAIGDPTTTGAGPYEHVFVPEALQPGFVLEKDYTGSIASKVEKFNGCRVSTAQFNFPQEGFATIDYQVFALSRSIVTGSIDAAGGLDDPGHNGVTGFSGIIKVEGSQVGGIKSFTFTLDNELDTGIYCYPASGGTAGDPHSLPEGRAKITGSFEAIFDTVNGFNFIDYAENQTDVQFEIVQTIGTGAGTAGNEALSFLIDHSRLQPVSPTIDTPNGISVTYNFQAFSSGSDMGLVVTIDNAVAAAAI